MKLSLKVLVVECSYGAPCLLWRLGQKFYGFYCRYNLLLQSVFSCPAHMSITFVPYLENPFIILFQKKGFERFVVLSNPHASFLSINLQHVESALLIRCLAETKVCILGWCPQVVISIFFSEKRHALQTSFATAAQGNSSEIDGTQWPHIPAVYEL